MPVEKSAGAVIFRKDTKGAILFLLLQYPSAGHRSKRDFWDFPKGHIEKNEKEQETVKREILEETGLRDIGLQKGFKEENRYFFMAEGKTIFKTVVFYLAKTKEKEIKISQEHAGFVWLPLPEALSKLTFKNAKEILKKANNFILRQSL